MSLQIVHKVRFTGASRRMLHFVVGRPLRWGGVNEHGVSKVPAPPREDPV